MGIKNMVRKQLLVVEGEASMLTVRYVAGNRTSIKS